MDEELKNKVEQKADEYVSLLEMRCGYIEKSLRNISRNSYIVGYIDCLEEKENERDTEEKD